MISFIKKLFGFSEGPSLVELVKAGAVLVDVRNPNEFSAGHVKGSVNIPLGQLEQKLNSLKGKSHIVVFCQSGMRSMQAKSILNRNGFENVINAGSWMRVNAKLQTK